jgi:hypothetical protein
VAHIAVVGVNADTPYKTMPELLVRHFRDIVRRNRPGTWRSIRR